MAKLLFKLRLAGQHNLQEFLRRGLKIGEQTNLFQQFPGKVLRFVNDDHAGLFHSKTLNQPAVELQQHAGFGPSSGHDAEVGENELQKVQNLKSRIEDESRRDAASTEGSESPAKQRRLTCTDLSGQYGETFPGRDTVLKTGKRLPCMRHHVEKPRIRAGAK